MMTGAELMMARHKLGYTLPEMAKACGVSREYIKQMEGGRKVTLQVQVAVEVHLRQLEKAAEAMGDMLDELVAKGDPLWISSAKRLRAQGLESPALSSFGRQLALWNLAIDIQRAKGKPVPRVELLR